MRRSAVLLLCACLLLGAACYGDDETSGVAGPRGIPATPSGPNFAPGHVLLEGSEGSVLLDVEIAQTEEQRNYGLMNRDSLAEDSGMAFVFFEPTSGGFWMKDTRIPLSIAFFDVDGKILEILDMEPCTENPCDVYNPGVTYMGALEVNQGAFERWGVSEGDSLNLVPADE